VQPDVIEVRRIQPPALQQHRAHLVPRFQFFSDFLLFLIDFLVGRDYGLLLFWIDFVVGMD